jgi:CO/xanthine dehydrogenase Mo-binding subunit
VDVPRWNGVLWVMLAAAAMPALGQGLAPACRPEATQAAKNLLKVTWSDAPGAHLDSERALEEFAAIGRDKSREGVPYEAVGDAKTAMLGAARVYRGEYRTRYIYHAQREPVNATAAVSPDGKSVEIWAGTQGAGEDSGRALHDGRRDDPDRGGLCG